LIVTYSFMNIFQQSWVKQVTKTFGGVAFNEGVVGFVAECTLAGFVWDKNKGSGKAGREVGSTAEKIKKNSGEGNRNNLQ